MKKKMISLRACIATCAAIGWWGLLYPELVLTPDTVEVYEENDDSAPIPRQWSFDDEIYRELLTAGRDKITFRSRLFTDLSLFWEAYQNGNK